MTSFKSLLCSLTLAAPTVLAFSLPSTASPARNLTIPNQSPPDTVSDHLDFSQNIMHEFSAILNVTELRDIEIDAIDASPLTSVSVYAPEQLPNIEIHLQKPRTGLAYLASSDPAHYGAWDPYLYEDQPLPEFRPFNPASFRVDGTEALQSLRLAGYIDPYDHLAIRNVSATQHERYTAPEQPYYIFTWGDPARGGRRVKVGAVDRLVVLVAGSSPTGLMSNVSIT